MHLDHSVRSTSACPTSTPRWRSIATCSASSCCSGCLDADGVLRRGDVRLYLGVPESPEVRSKVVLYFTVADIDAEYERLRHQHG